MSVVSMVSTRSVYTHSTLLVEIPVNGDIKYDSAQSYVSTNVLCRYFLIPTVMLDNYEARKLMKRGKKLHIFNEHIFVAVKVKGYPNGMFRELLHSSVLGAPRAMCAVTHSDAASVDRRTDVAIAT
jgi:hypothetical protein